MNEEWVLVGRSPDLGPPKVMGPFADPDDARTFCNGIGFPDFEWDVVPLMRV